MKTLRNLPRRVWPKIYPLSVTVDRTPFCDATPLPQFKATEDDSEVETIAHATRDIRKILVPVEIDERSKHLLLEASSLARCLHAKLVLLHVCQHLEYASAHTTPAQFDKCNDAILHLATENFADLRADLGDDPQIARAQSVVLAGSLEEKIEEVCRTYHIDLILVSTHAHHGIKRLFLGSKAETILRHANCPVLAIPDRCDLAHRCVPSEGGTSSMKASAKAA